MIFYQDVDNIMRNNHEKIVSKYILKDGVKIEEISNQVPRTLTVVTFYQVWHIFMLIHAKLDKII